MDVYILGNGFDLSHSFPTTYLDFLCVVDYLSSNYNNSMITVGSILENKELHKKNKHIEICYNEHKEIYNKTSLNVDDITYLVDTAKSNEWFKYLKQALIKDLGWIDFEKEISTVLEAFRYFFNHIAEFTSDKEGDRALYITSMFPFFLKNEKNTNKSGLWVEDEIKEIYLTETPPCSSVYELNTEKIVTDLYQKLEELSQMLKIYLKVFVDEVCLEMKRDNIFSYNSSFSNIISTVFTFNYTNTFETLFDVNSHVIHIHGNTNDNKIVLGINSDKYDEEPDLDTLFVEFKKYFQRNFINSEIIYKTKLKATYLKNYDLHIMGHSLDVTDKDIIIELLKNANSIIIYYHDVSAKKQYLKNLIKLFGKRGYDKLYEEKNLHILPHARMLFKKKEATDDHTRS